MHPDTQRAPKIVYDRAAFMRDLLSRSLITVETLRARFTELLKGDVPAHLGLTAGPGDNLAPRLALNLAKLEEKRGLLALCPMSGNTLLFEENEPQKVCPRCRRTEGTGARFGKRTRRGVQKPQSLCYTCRNKPAQRVKPRTVFTHANCADGNACAAMFKTTGFAEEVIPLTLPVKASVTTKGKIHVVEESTGRSWCVKRAVFADLTPKFEDTGHIPTQGALVVLDHHDGAYHDWAAMRERVKDNAGKSQIVLDPEECGASLVAKWIAWMRRKTTSVQRVFQHRTVQVPEGWQDAVRLVRLADLNLGRCEGFHDAKTLAVFGRARENYGGLFMGEITLQDALGVGRGLEAKMQQELDAVASEVFVFDKPNRPACQPERVLIYTDVPRKALIQPLYTSEVQAQEIKDYDLAVFVCREVGAEGISFRGPKALLAAQMLGGGGHTRAAGVTKVALTQGDTTLPAIWGPEMSEDQAAHLIFETISPIF